MLLLRQQRKRKLHGRGSKDFFSVFWKDSQCERFSIIGCCQFHLGVQTTEERKEELLHEAFQVPPPPVSLSTITFRRKDSSFAAALLLDRDPAAFLFRRANKVCR